MMLIPFAMRSYIGKNFTHVIIIGLETCHDTVPDATVIASKFSRTSQAYRLENLINLALGEGVAVGQLLTE